MKNIIWIVVLVIIILVAWFWFGKETASNEKPLMEFTDVPTALAVEPGEYRVADESNMLWQGKKTLIKDYMDSGMINIKSGIFSANEAGISGTLIIDMQSISASKTATGDGEDYLSTHLKSEDFFAVEEFPEAIFTLASLTPRAEDEMGNYLAEGTLTMKGITNAVSFPIRIIANEGGYRAQAEFAVDRTLWDVKFASSKFFSDLANNVIADEMEIAFDILLVRAE